MKTPMKAFGLVGLSLLFLIWNVALATRRKYYSGEMFEVKKEDVVLKVSCPGKIEPKVQETIRAIVEGNKKAVYVHEGDAVQKGQLLMEISDQKIRTELNQKETAFRNAMSDYSKAQKDYQLEQSLFKQGAVPRRDVENAKQTYERAGQTLIALQEDLGVTQRKAKGISVFSPMTGVILRVFVENDTNITVDKELIKVAQPEYLIVKGLVDELDIANVALGQDVVVTCDAFPGVEIKGKVSWIGAQAKDGAFAEVEVNIDLVDTKGLNLKPNLSCEASIITGQIPNAIVLPVQGVRHDGPHSDYVLKSHFGGWLRSQPVKVARVSGGTAVITEGIEVGDSILVPSEK